MFHMMSALQRLFRHSNSLQFSTSLSLPSRLFLNTLLYTSAPQLANMVDFRNPPKYWNSYRPTYSPPPRDQGRRSRQPRNAGITPNYPHGQVPPPYPGAYGNDVRNPNLSLVAPRYRSSNGNSYRDDDYEQDHDYDDGRDNGGDDDEYNGPQLWDPSLDKLMGRTARAYDLVINYERDSEGGKRWSYADIVRIHRTGKQLHNNISALKAWQRCAATDLDHRLIAEDAAKTRELCEVVQNLIAETENKTGFEIALTPTAPLDDWSASGGYKVMGMGMNIKQDDDDYKNQENTEGSQHVKTDMATPSHPRYEDQSSQAHKPQRDRLRYTSRGNRRQRRAQEVDCYRPGREADSYGPGGEQGTAGRLGKHVLHF
jgi:hypothetical protein